MDSLQLDARDMKPRPCSECEEVIAETVAAFNDDGHNYIDEEFDYNDEIPGHEDKLLREADLGDTEW